MPFKDLLHDLKKATSSSSNMPTSHSRASGKRGISVPWNFDASDFSLYASAIDNCCITWVSNWEMWKPQGLPLNVEYVPQCRTADTANQIPGYLTNYSNTPADNVRNFMGFNEPDIPSQANMDVPTAVQLWKQHVLPTKANLPPQSPIRIGSPAISNAPEGLAWLRSFIGALGGIQASGLDFLVVHYYSPSVSHFKQYLTEIHHEFPGIPIWVTEFACTDWNPNDQKSEREVLEFMREALRFLDEKDWIEKYAWFGSMRDVDDAVGKGNVLQKRDGRGLTKVGEFYCGR